MSLLDFVKWCIETHPDGSGAFFMLMLFVGLPMIALMWHSMWGAIGKRR